MVTWECSMYQVFSSQDMLNPTVSWKLNYRKLNLSFFCTYLIIVLKLMFSNKAQIILFLKFWFYLEFRKEGWESYKVSDESTQVSLRIHTQFSSVSSQDFHWIPCRIHIRFFVGFTLAFVYDSNTKSRNIFISIIA